MIEESDKLRELGDPPSRKRATLLQAAGGYALTGITIVQGLVLIPLYLHYIGAHTYGLWLASGGILGMLGLMNFGIGSMLIQRIASFYGKREFAQAGAYFINGMVVYLGICLLLGIVGWAVSLWLPEILTVTGDDSGLLRQCFQLAVVAMVLAVFNECLRSFSQALLRPVIPMLGMVVGRVVGIGVTIWMLFDDFGLWAVPAGTLVAECAIVIVNILNAMMLFKMLAAKFRLDYKIIKEYMRTSPALLLSRTGNTLSQESEPLLVTIFLGPEMTTAYMIVRKAADMVLQMLSVVYGASHSAFSHLAGEGDNEKTWGIASKLLLLVFVFSLIGFASYVGANQAFVSLWVGDEFVLSPEVILLVGLGFFVRSLRNMLWQILNGLGDFVYSSWVIIAEGVTKVGLAILLLSLFGVVGVPCALIVSSLLTLVLFGSRIKKVFVIRVDLAFVIRSLLSVVALFGSGILIPLILPGYESWGMFALFAVGLLGVLVVLFGIINFQMCSVYIKRGIAWVL